MIDKNQARLRRARKTRLKIAELKSVRLSVHRTNSHIYAQVFSSCGSKVLAAASSLEPEVRKNLSNGGNVGAATVIGKLIAERAKQAGIEQVAFDRGGRFGAQLLRQRLGGHQARLQIRATLASVGQPGLQHGCGLARGLALGAGSGQPGFKVNYAGHQLGQLGCLCLDLEP